ncbi:MAG: four helix bundle protein [Nonlabens sp.]
MNDFNFENLMVYQKSLDFIDEVHAVVDKFPKHELYSLRSQFTRAANSIALNISEGHGDTDRQFNRYLTMAQGSVRECVVCTTLAQRREYIDDKDKDVLRSKLVEIAKMISSLKNKLK